MVEEKIVDLIVDEEFIMRQLQNIENKTKEVDELVEKTGKKSKNTWLLAVGVAQASWTLFDSLITSMGGTMSGVLRATIQGAFSAIAIIQPILAATAVTPGMQIMAAFGFMQIAAAITAAQRAESQMGEISGQLTKSGLGDVKSFIGSFNFS